MKQVLLVFLGGGTGSVLRFLISRWLNPFSSIPYGTFLVNILGSLLIGFILGWAVKTENLSSNTVLILAVGFCGGFTTFSAFAYENQNLLRIGDFLNFALYTLASILLGIAAVLTGMWLSRFV